MKRIITSIFTLMLTIGFLHAQNDTMYVMKNGMVINKQSVKQTDVDSIIFYKPQTQSGNTFTDSRDGNDYQFVTIGNQVWMAENLKYLPSVVGPGTHSTSNPFYYVYDYDGTDVNAAKTTAKYTTYGVLYNWPAAMNSSESSTANPSGVKGVCPTGWHLPSDAEWTELTEYLGGASVAGGKLKETGTTHWESPNADASNETGFTALPGGNRIIYGPFDNIGSNGYWWSATDYFTFDAWGRSVNYNYGYVNRYYYDKERGFSVRCIRD